MNTTEAEQHAKKLINHGMNALFKLTYGDFPGPDDKREVNIEKALLKASTAIFKNELTPLEASAIFMVASFTIHALSADRKLGAAAVPA